MLLASWVVRCCCVSRDRQSPPPVPALGTQEGRGWVALWHAFSVWALERLWSDCMNVSRIQGKPLA